MGAAARAEILRLFPELRRRHPPPLSRCDLLRGEAELLRQAG
jgi:hypothetical protein